MTSASDHQVRRRRGAVTRLLAVSGNRVLRTQDLAPFYSNPAKEAARLTEHGILVKLATGYFVIVPEDRRDGAWRPAIEDVALGMGVADYGVEHTALVGPSAARVLGVLPRALSNAVLAVPVHRDPLTTTAGKVIFTFQDTGRLDLQRTTTEMVTGYVTTPEQTLLDLATRPSLGGISLEQAAEARGALLSFSDLERVRSLARAQHRRAALGVIGSDQAASA